MAYSVDEAALLTGLSRDLLYDEMRRGNLTYVKVGRRRLITRQHLQQSLGIALAQQPDDPPRIPSQPAPPPGRTRQQPPGHRRLSLTAATLENRGPVRNPDEMVLVRASRRASSRTCSLRAADRDGIAAADARGTAVDHVTARRLAICLAARPQSPVFAQNLVRFIRTGTVSQR